jgi:hypothetical protein
MPLFGSHIFGGGDPPGDDYAPANTVVVLSLADAQQDVFLAKADLGARLAELLAAKGRCAERGCGGPEDRVLPNSPTKWGLIHAEHGDALEAAYRAFQVATQNLVEAERQLLISQLTSGGQG